MAAQLYEYNENPELCTSNRMYVIWIETKEVHYWKEWKEIGVYIDLNSKEYDSIYDFYNMV
jgi:hypothetical protein